MKKVLSVVMVVAMMASLSACGSGSKFSKHQKKNIKAAEDVCGASEASAKEKKKLIKDKDDDSMYEDGLYFSFDADDMESFSEEDKNFEGTDVDYSSVSKMFAFRKLVMEDQSSMYSIIYEFTDKDSAEEIYDALTSRYQKTEKQLKKAAKEEDIEYASEDNDTEYSLIAVNNDREETVSAYCKIDGKVVVMVIYNGTADVDLLDEYYEFMNECGYTDMEELLEEA